jgi:hypothetical protein
MKHQKKQDYSSYSEHSEKQPVLFLQSFVQKIHDHGTPLFGLAGWWNSAAIVQASIFVSIADCSRGLPAGLERHVNISVLQISCPLFPDPLLFWLPCRYVFGSLPFSLSFLPAICGAGAAAAMVGPIAREFPIN